MSDIPARAICERCRNPRPLHKGGIGQCTAPGCHAGPDGAPCLGFIYGGMIIATGKPWPPGEEADHDPREYGLTAADLRDASDLLYAPGDPRLDEEPVTWDHAAQVRFGGIRSRLRGLADAIDAGSTTRTGDRI
jgi:hypothetical protein